MAAIPSIPLGTNPADVVQILTPDEVFVVEHMTLSWMQRKAEQLGFSNRGYTTFCQLAKRARGLASGVPCSGTKLKGSEGKTAFATYLKNALHADGEGGSGLQQLFTAYGQLDNWSKIGMASLARRGYHLRAKRQGFVTMGCFLGADKDKMTALYNHYGLGALPSTRFEQCQTLTKALVAKGMSMRELGTVLSFVGGDGGSLKRPLPKPKKTEPTTSGRMEETYKKRVLGVKDEKDEKKRTELDYVKAEGHDWPPGTDVQDTVKQIKAFQEKYYR